MPDRKQYYCEIPCWHMGHRFHKGARVFLADDELPKNSKGQNAGFFLPVEPEAAPAEKPESPDEPVVKVNEKKRTGK